MRVVRYQTADGEPRCGWIQDDLVGEIDGDLFGPYMRREAKTPISDVKLLAPIVAGQDHLRGPELRGACQGTAATTSPRYR